MFKPKLPQLPTNFAALRRYAHVSHSVAHSRELHYPDISHEDLLEQQSAYDVKLTEAILEVRRRIMDEEMALSTVMLPFFCVVDLMLTFSAVTLPTHDLRL